MKRTIRRAGAPLLALLLAAPVLFAARTARAGGFYLTDRGAKPLGRGFAYTAGSDDPHALWYNPANLAWSGQQLLLDATLTLFDASYTRVDSGGNVLPTVEASPPLLPIPTLAYTDDFGVEDFTFGFGVLAPNAVLLDWPGQIEVAGEVMPAPQRYSLITMKGTVLAHVVVAAAWHPTPELSFGIAPQLVVGSFDAEVMVTACDGVICTQPENPEYDGLAQVKIAPIIRPAAELGFAYDAGIVRVGASAMLPFNVGGKGTFHVRLPEAAFFDGAEVEGDGLEANIKFPWILRLGAEVRPVEHLALEADFVIEGWKREDRIRLEPQGVSLTNVTAIGTYEVGPVDIPRHMNNVYSVRVGGEYGFLDGRLVASAGMTYENGAFDDAYLTPLTLDSNKVVVGVGVSAEVTPGVWLDASYGHVFLQDRTVTDSRVPQANPIRPPPQGPSPTQGGPAYVGNGEYAMEANVIGVGLRWQLDVAGETPPAGEPEPDEPRASDEPAPEVAPAGAPGPEPGSDSESEPGSPPSEPAANPYS